MQDPQGKLAENIVYFARALRAAGIPVGPGSVLDALHAVRAAGVGTRDDFYWTLHAVFVKRHDHSILFDQAFKIFFRKRGYLEQLMAMMPPEMSGTPVAEQPAGLAARAGGAVLRRREEGAEKDEYEIDARFTVSDREMLQSKDFAQMSAAEIAAAKDGDQAPGAGLRRGEDAAAGTRTATATSSICAARLRASMKAGGAVIDLKYRGRKTRVPPIVALLDISGSMSQYTRLFLHFLHAITDERKRVHTFLFGTRLTNVTRALKEKDPDEALAACSASVLDWSGGTRIATSLHIFNKLWARRVLTQGAIVLLFTDGLERDPDDAARLRDRPAAPLVPAADLAQPVAAVRGLRGQGPRHQGHAAACRRTAADPQSGFMAELCRALSEQGRHVDPKTGWLE